MRTKYLVITAICFLISLNSLYADTVFLKNGNTLEGNITVSDDESIILDVAEDGELIGCKLKFNLSEIEEVIFEDAYRALQKPKLSKDEEIINRKEYEKRAEFLHRLAEQNYQWEVYLAKRLRDEERTDHLIGYAASLVSKENRSFDVGFGFGESQKIVIENSQ